MQRKSVTLVLVVSFLALPLLGGCSSKVTKENFEKIKADMTLQQVEDILGKGEKQAGGSASVGGVTVGGDVYVWKDGDKTITVTFVNGKVSGVPVAAGL